MKRRKSSVTPQVEEIEEVERRLLRTREAARYLGITEDSLKEARSSGRLPLPIVRIGQRGIRYDLHDLEAEIERRKVRPDSEAAR